ncbi:UNVERIFIED_CONTAM: hypothetical protein Slati_2479400 [Sesamum latifolium]|uniref:Uncharacterized protein n=1 Tax=Sesamum latifolium TaxID=2727402 RepID=A0AAW2WFG7_9LAMI
MAESRYTGHVEDELRRNPSRGAGHYGGSSKGSTSGAKRGISQLWDSDPYMQSMIDTIAEVGPGVKGPSRWEKYWKIIDDRWYRQLHRHLHAASYFFNPVLQYSNTCVFETAEVRRGVKEVIKRLELDLIVQTNAMNEIRTFVDKLREFGTPLARQVVSTSLSGKGKHVSSEKAKEVTFKDKSAQVSSSINDKHVLPSSSNYNDSDDETDEDDGDDDDDDDDGDDDDDNDNDGDGNVHKKTQQSHGMTWAEGDKNYYATQDTDHGYRPEIENQRRFLSNLTDYPSQYDDSQSQRYDRRQPDIQYSMQNLKIDEHIPHQMHGHQGSSICTNSDRSNARRRNRGSATDSISESNRCSSIESSHSSGTGTYSQGFG